MKGASGARNTLIASNRGYGDIGVRCCGYVLSGYGNNTLVNNNGAGGLGTDGQFIRSGRR